MARTGSDGLRRAKANGPIVGLTPPYLTCSVRGEGTQWENGQVWVPAPAPALPAGEVWPPGHGSSWKPRLRIIKIRLTLPPSASGWED